METTKKANDYLTIRLDKALKEKLRALAERERRSMVAQVLMLVEEALDARKTPPARNGIN